MKHDTRANAKIRNSTRRVGPSGGECTQYIVNAFWPRKLEVSALTRDLSSSRKFNLFRAYQHFWVRRFPCAAPRQSVALLSLAPEISPTPKKPIFCADHIYNFCRSYDNLGQFFLAVTVARLVGRQVARQAGGDDFDG